ncbi:thioredoxin family protein [Sulfurimonas sp.]|uniref:thioredoxin family protein n=1 Tax=Sulfurimonas sp. TaxID=2022749 RepID=UPI00356378CC
MSEVLELNDSNYAEFIAKTDSVVFIDFYSTTCAPCQTLLSYLPKIAEHYEEEKVIVAKVNTEKNPKLTAKFMVRSVPLTVVIGEDKMVKKADVGLLAIDKYIKTIDKALGKDVGLFARLFG